MKISQCIPLLGVIPATFAWVHLTPSFRMPLKTSKSQLFESKRVSFSKYEGLGNDFILVDDRDKTEPSLTPEESSNLCNRNFAVGGDGVIFALAPPEGKTSQ